MSTSLSSSPEEYHDYTEGATADDIEYAISQTRSAERSRRGSQVGLTYADGDEGDGAVFDGPEYGVAIPSSVSRMSHRGMSLERAGRLRRMSSDYEQGASHSRRVRRSVDGLGEQLNSGTRNDDTDIFALSDDESEVEDTDPATGDTRRLGRRKRRRRSISPDALRTSVFENIAQIFGGRSTNARESSSRRPSISHRSSLSLRRSRRSRPSSRSSQVGSEYALETAEDEQERWGYSSGEEDNSSDDQLGREVDLGIISDTEFGSLPPSPTGSLPNIALDPIFGDTRIDIDMVPEPPEPPPPGPPSRQSIFLPDEDITVRFIGYEIISRRQWIWRIGCFISVGLLGLLGHWFPKLWLRSVAKEKAFKDSQDGFIVVEVQNYDRNSIACS